MGVCLVSFYYANSDSKGFILSLKHTIVSYFFYLESKTSHQIEKRVKRRSVDLNYLFADSGLMVFARSSVTALLVI